MSSVAQLPKQIIVQGTDQSIELRHATRASKSAPIVPVNIGGCQLRMQIRAFVSAPAVLDELTTENGRIVIVDAADGRYSLKFPHTGTSSQTWRKGVADLEIVYADGTVDRLWRAQFELDAEVTRET